jgi:hypothetical protein
LTRVGESFGVTASRHLCPFRKESQIAADSIEELSFIKRVSSGPSNGRLDTVGSLTLEILPSSTTSSSCWRIGLDRYPSMPAAREDAATTDETILNLADAMLYQAKIDGRDKVVIVN